MPPVLQVLDEPEERGEGCAFCGGLGHTILDCPKRDKDARRLNANRRDMLSGTGGPGGTRHLENDLSPAPGVVVGYLGSRDAGSLHPCLHAVGEWRLPCRARAPIPQLNSFWSRGRRRLSKIGLLSTRAELPRGPL